MRKAQWPPLVKVDCRVRSNIQKSTVKMTETLKNGL